MKLTEEELLAPAVRGLVDRIAELEAALAQQKSVNADYVHIIREHQERISKYESCQSAGAVAPGECVSVPNVAIEWIDQWDCKNSVTIGEAAVFLKRFFDDWPGGFDEIESSINGWRQRALAAQAGMQPPNNQPNLTCKSCGADRSKEDCKGDRLRCGLAGIAHSDHVAVTSADLRQLLMDAKRAAGAVGNREDAIDDTDQINADSVIKRIDTALQSGISSTPFRPNEQNAVQTEQPSLSNALDVYEAQTEALPLGHEIPERGESTYNWQTAAIRDIRALLAQGQDSDKDPMDWSLPCDVFVGHGTFKKGVKLRTLVARMKVLYEMATGKDADAIANGAKE